MIKLEDNMLIFDAIDAAHGDSILLRYFDSVAENAIMMLIDGGPKSAHRANNSKYIPYEATIVPWLKQVQKSMNELGAIGVRGINSKLVLDLVVCTHIDDDHIAGIDRLYDCLANGEKCAPGGSDIKAKRLWFNSFSKMAKGVNIDNATTDTPEVVTVSVKQGEDVTRNAIKYFATINEDALGSLVAGIHEWTTHFKPAKVTVLNPDKKSLEKLAKDWKKAAAKMKQEIAAQDAAGKFPVDRAVPNLSSIVMAVECFGRSVLLTGDQLGKTVVKALEASNLPQKDGVFHFDIVKVPHHGSIANVQPIFVDKVTADIFVFSANGKDQNPDPPTLELYAKASKTRKFTMAFTNGDLAYETSANKPLPKIGGKKIKNLDEALAELARIYPTFKTNVKILKRSADSHAISFGIKKGNDPILVSGGTYA